MQNSVVSNDSPILSSNVKSLQDLKAESPNKKLDRESLKQVCLIYVTYCKKDTELEKNIYDEDFTFYGIHFNQLPVGMISNVDPLYFSFLLMEFGH